MEYFALDTEQSDADPTEVEAALRRAWNACAGVACTKCGVSAGQYCRNQTRGIWRVARFHRPRQDTADVPRILAAVNIRGLSWAKAKAGSLGMIDAFLRPKAGGMVASP